MAILVNENTRVLVQGITGREGSRHTQYMLQYGTKILAGVTPGKGGQSVHGVPVFDTVEEALRKFPEINTSIIFVPAQFAADSVYEAIDAGIKLIVIITEHIPIHDTLRFVNYAKRRGVTIIGPNCPGVVSPLKSKVGILPNHIYTKSGPVGIVSRSGTLTYEISYHLTQAGIGQSTVVGVGGDPIVGTDMVEVIKMFEEDPETKYIVVIGEIGGTMEERVAQYIGSGKVTKPVVAYIAGRTAPPGKRMGHAGAIVSMGMGSYESKVRAFQEVNVPVARTPTEVVKLIKKLMP
ncbi:MAG: succinate--CoA ligase subunit alpha [Vulcanisaeta sp.]|nr:succinate--CoA ligase subunit alpha [Vulcanisaeta sp.]MCG2870358.1 succinate--CoA ligase subunit alpha [Vulcanisaeta sp.]MCG2880678.1 succinate--CoA ligase subunit alpha [Vulcanisaeta sp.]MCG2887627.1 succinate--CoA ligase subunit alpha [Vulcanisaeta sp.]MCG2892364.1 succinate--CoA ligase subunit alpha [Vulcanisaeta sp.]